VSIRLTLRSTAALIVLIDSASSVPPHIHPPIAQVPRPTRDTVSEVPAMAADLVSNSGVIASPISIASLTTGI
jgi:hypothetical protein